MYLTEQQLQAIGFKSIGKDCLISDKCSIYNAKNISLGDSVRIDDWTLLSAGEGISIGSNVHISCYACILGKGLIIIYDFCAISIGAKILSSSDDFTVSQQHGVTDKKVVHGTILIGKNSVVGAGTVIVPNGLVGYNSAVGANSLVKDLVDNNSIYAGNPAKKIGDRT